MISLKKLIVCFPASMILAILLNAIPGVRYKKAIQTVSYIPHFLSTVVVCSIVRTVTSIDGGIIHVLIKAFGGELLNAGFEQVFLLYSSSVYETGDIIDTYVYREGLINLNYSYSTAVNLFKSIITMVLVPGSNFFAKKMGQEGIW